MTQKNEDIYRAQRLKLEQERAILETNEKLEKL